MVALQAFHQPRAAQDFGVEPFSGQKEDGKVGGVRWGNVAFGYCFGFKADAGFKLAGGLLGGFGVGALLGFEQALVVFVGEFGINRQP